MILPKFDEAAIYYMLHTGRGGSQHPWQEGRHGQRFARREQPRGSGWEVQETFLLPAEAAQVPSWGLVGSVEIEKAIEYWEGEPAARKGG